MKTAVIADVQGELATEFMNVIQKFVGGGG